MPHLSNSPCRLLKKIQPIRKNQQKEKKINFNRVQMNTESKKEAHSELFGIRPGHPRKLLHRDLLPILQLLYTRDWVLSRHSQTRYSRELNPMVTTLSSPSGNPKSGEEKRGKVKYFKNILKKIVCAKINFLSAPIRYVS